MAETPRRDWTAKRPQRSAEETRRHALDLALAKQKKKAAQTRFYRDLEKYMRSRGKHASADDVLRAAEQIWHANEVVRKLQQPRRERDDPDSPARRPPPKRVTRIVSGGLPGQKRRK